MFGNHGQYTVPWITFRESQRHKGMGKKRKGWKVINNDYILIIAFFVSIIFYNVNNVSFY
jgi:hypothetical protein